MFLMRRKCRASGDYSTCANRRKYQPGSGRSWMKEPWQVNPIGDRLLQTKRFIIITVDWRCNAEQYWTSGPAISDTHFGNVSCRVGQISYTRYTARLGGMAISMGCCLLPVRDHLRINATLGRPQ